MGIDNKYFSYCKEIGLMKENYTHQAALNKLIQEVRAAKAVDPQFVATVSALTLSSREVSVRSCAIYHYNVNLTYAQYGNIKHGTVSGLVEPKGGSPSSLKVSNYSGEGAYTTIKDGAAIPYPAYNSNGLFTYEEMRQAMSEHLKSKVPSGTTSYESKDWSVAAFIVPVLTVTIYHGGKAYYLYYNLQNGRWSIEWPDDPALINKGKKAKKIGLLIKIASFVLPILGFLLSGLGEGTSNALDFVVPIAAIILNIFIAKKTKKSNREFEQFFIKKPNAPLASAMIAPIAMAVVGFLALIITFMAV